MGFNVGLAAHSLWATAVVKSFQPRVPSMELPLFSTSGLASQVIGMHANCNGIFYKMSRSAGKARLIGS